MATPSPISNFQQIVRIASGFWPWAVGISFSIIIASLLRQLPPQLQKQLIDRLTLAPDTKLLGFELSFYGLLLSFLVIIIIQTLLDRMTWSFSNRFQSRFNLHLRQIAYEKLLSLPVSYFNKERSGSLMSKVDRGSSRLTNAIHNLAANIFPNVITAVIAVVIVAAVRWEIAVAVILGFVLYFPLRIQRFRLIEKLDKKIHKLWDKSYGHFYEAISSIRLIKIFTAEVYELRLFQRFHQKAVAYDDQDDHIQNQFIFANIFLNIWLWGILAYVFYLGLQSHFSIGTIVLLIQYVDIIRQPFTSLEWTFWEIKRAQVGAKDYFKILNVVDNTYRSPDPVTPPISGHIKFDNVSFKYKEKGGQSVFKNLSLNIKPGQTLAVVGRSGAGKTTLAHLLVRFFDPDTGKISVDGHDVKEFDLNYLRRHISLVMQESFLFADTIAENLRYAKPSATDEEMRIAASVANATEFIDKLPKGLNTLIGERGIKLSGGQKQRLNIARAVLKNAPILVLDEATSSLDSHSEKLVQEALGKLIKGRTTIIIAHRLSTIQNADNIIVLDELGIAEQGTHHQLLEKDGIYASLHRIQAGITDVDKLKEWDLLS